MTEERITEKFNGSAATIINGLKLWLPLFLAFLSLVTSLYTYKIKDEILDNVRDGYISNDQLVPIKKEIDKVTFATDSISASYIHRDIWDKTIPDLIKKVNQNDVDKATLSQELLFIKSILLDLKSELKEIKTEMRK